MGFVVSGTVGVTALRVRTTESGLYSARRIEGPDKQLTDIARS